MTEETMTTREEFSQLTETGKYRRVEAAEIRADKLERQVERFRQWYNHWRGVLMLAVERMEPADFDEAYARRIKAGK